MDILTNHPLWAKKKDDFQKLVFYLKNTLHSLKFSGAIVFGSTIRGETTEENTDIDIVVYSDEFSRETSGYFQKIILEHGGDFLDKQPLFIEDFISPRIEFYIRLGSTVFDINVFPNALGGYENRYVNSTHDSLDIVIGAMYKEARLLFGSIPFEQLLQDEFIPFYCDELRKSRMDILEHRIRSEYKKLRASIENGQDDLFYQIYKIRTYLMKWIFINARKYPVDCNRYIRRQLTEEIGLSCELADKLLLKSGSSLKAFADFTSALLYILDNMKNGLLE